MRVCASGLLLARLRECSRHLSRALLGLDIYLAAKRRAFPRFYFLSNDERVSRLSQSADPIAIQVIKF